MAYGYHRRSPFIAGICILFFAIAIISMTETTTGTVTGIADSHCNISARSGYGSSLYIKYAAHNQEYTVRTACSRFSQKIGDSIEIRYNKSDNSKLSIVDVSKRDLNIMLAIGVALIAFSMFNTIRKYKRYVRN